MRLLQKLDGWDEFLARFVPCASAENKQLLLKMAERGDDRPKWKTPLGRALSPYTTKGQGSYDPEFDKQIRDLRRDWFVNSATEKKKQLLEIARRGDDKPHWKSVLGQAFYNYTSKSQKSSYDPEFDKQIRELRPDWFK